MEITKFIRQWNVGTDYADEQNNPHIRRGRFIGPRCIFRYPDYFVKTHYRPSLDFLESGLFCQTA
jgi:hypothetical protein